MPDKLRLDKKTASRIKFSNDRMKIKKHVFFSVVLAGVLQAVFNSWIFTIMSFVSGILIDVDHYIDYIIEYGFSLNLKEFFRIYGKKLNKKTYIFFHSWELLFFLYIGLFLTNWNLWLAGIFVGFGQHILLDHFNEPYIRWLYSFVWRWRKDFVIPWNTGHVLKLSTKT